MIISEIKLFELLKARIGAKEAEAFVEILETRVDNKFNESKPFMATKEDLSRLEAKLTAKMFFFTLAQIVIILSSLLAIVRFMIK